MRSQSLRSYEKTDGGLSFDEEIAATLQRIEEHLAAIRESQNASFRQWLTMEDVAEELQVSKDTVERLVCAGHLKATILTTSRGKGWRRRYRIHRDWVAEFLLASVKQALPAKKSVRQSRAQAGVAIFLE